MEGFKLIHFHLLLDHREVFDDVVLQNVDRLSLVLNPHKVGLLFYFVFQLEEVAIALLSYFLILENLEALVLDVLNLTLELTHGARQIVSKELFRLTHEEIVTHFLEFHAFFDAHVGPSVLNIRDTAIVDRC